MSTTEMEVYSAFVKVNGADLAPDVINHLTQLVVDQTLHAVDLVVLTFFDPDRSVLAGSPLEIGAPLEVGVRTLDDGTATLAWAEITALEMEHDGLGTSTIVRGLDKRHRLMRGRKTRSWQNVSYADVARKVISEAGLRPGTIDNPGGVLKHVVQHGQSDWEFLHAVAAEIGFDVTVAAGKVNFVKPPTASTAPAPGTYDRATARQLTLGTNLLRVRAVVRGTEQVKEVVARGWDPATKKEIVGRAAAATTSAVVGGTPAKFAGLFGNPTYAATDVPYRTTAEANGAAKAIAEQIGSSFAELEGETWGDPELRPGETVSLALAGPPFDGKYTLTSTRHVVDVNGYRTAFTVSGRAARDLLALTASNPLPARIAGVVTGIVTNNDDPEGLGRVKVKLPWLSAEYETDWCRVTHFGAGPSHGSLFIPEVNAEVLIAFDHGDARFPYVVGHLYNGKDKPKAPKAKVVAGGKVEQRRFDSRVGHRLVFSDKAGDEHIEVATSGDKCIIKMDATKTTITVTSKGDVTIDAQGAVKITATRNVAIEGQQVSIKGKAGVSIDGGPTVEVKGVQATLKGTAKAEVSGATVGLAGQALAEVKAALVKIN